MKTNKPKVVNDQKVRGMQPKSAPLVESLPGRGNGALLFKRPNANPPVCYYRYHVNGKQKLIKLGAYRRNPRDPGFSLPELRDMATQYARIATTHGDVKAYLTSQREEEAERQKALERAEEERRRREEIEAVHGTFQDLFQDYIESRREKATQRVVRELERIFDVDMLQPFPEILALKARDVQPEHIFMILTRIWERGAKVHADRVRSFLISSFNYGLRAEHSVGRSVARVYGLSGNPASSVSMEKTSVPVERALTDDELRQFWTTIGTTPGVGPVISHLLQFVIATGGQRIFNICQTTWDDYDLDAHTVRLAHRKGRGGQGMGRLHMVPLTERALTILEPIRLFNGSFEWPWTTTGNQHVSISTPTHAITKWLKSDRSVVNSKQVPPFTARDLRRTCAQIMQRHGISDSASDLLQAHGQTGVVSRHYRNNPEAALPEKWRAINSFDAALSNILDLETI